MPSGISRTETHVRVKPIEALGRTALLSGLFSLLPIFAVLGYLTHRSSALPVVVCIEVVVAVLFATVYIRFRLVFTAVSRTQFIKRRLLLPRVTVDRSRIDRLLVNRVFRSDSGEALLQLLGVDASGGRLFGMNALFWSDDDIDGVIAALDVRTVVNPTPMSRREYYRAFPMARGWYHTRPAVVIVALAVAILLILIVLTLESVMGPTWTRG
jgi:hypothetical protein